MTRPSHKPNPPDLETLERPPSWHNRAGRVDRSACFVLAASALWRQIPVNAWRYDPHADTKSAKRRGPLQPAPTPASNFRGRRPDRVGRITLNAEHLWHLHRFEKPAPLRGDFRTTKTNAFKPAAHATRWWNEISAHEAAQSLPGASTLDPPAVNPNRGAGFAMHLKMLGLPAHWQTTLTLERYIQHAKLKQHFLVCPVCGENKAADGIGALPNPWQSLCKDKPPSPPDIPADTIGGFGPKHNRPPKLPPGRVTKLFLPLCTPQEWSDAQLAHLWLQTNTHPNRPYSETAQKLLTRYAELFPGRQLRCRLCLGLRYGEVKGMK